MLLLRVCAGCGGPGPSPCGQCVSAVRAVGEMLPPEPLAGLWAAFAYTGEGRELLARLKYRNQRSCVGWVASAMAGALPAGLAADAVSWAPTSPQRRRRRGFDQAELLARALAREIGLPAVPMLRRVDAAGQTGRSRSQRSTAPVFSPSRRPKSAVLLVDDVVTTGATLRAAASSLIRAGALQVNAVVAGATPLPSSRMRLGVATMRAHSKAPPEKEPPWM